MDGRDLGLQRSIDESVSCQGSLLLKLRGHYDGGEGLSATTCGSRS